MIANQAPAVDEIRFARQAVYRFLRAALALPTAEQHAWMRGPDFAHALEELTQAFAVDFPEGELVPESLADHESRYLACFEVGMPGPPVPLLASHYQKREPTPQVIHEHLLFYRRFALPGPDRDQAPADHLHYQLAFLIHLDELLERDLVASESASWARHDFLVRHVCRWTATACRQATEKGLPGVYCTLLAILELAAAQDLDWTIAERAAQPEAP